MATPTHETRGNSRPVVSAGSARSLLLTVLGELVLPYDRPVWTSSLLYVLTGIGIEEQTARQAIARGAAAGWISSSKQGREVSWQLTPAGRNLIEEGGARVLSMSAAPPEWDGRWLVLLVTVPQSQRTVRKRLYGALGWAGFGNPTPGVWLSPHPDRAGEAEGVIRRLGLEESTLAFVGPSNSVGLNDPEIVQRAWDLDEVAARYEALIEKLTGLDPEPGDELLFTHIRVVSEWQRFPFMDPHLPEALLPDWIGRRASMLSERLREDWHDEAHARWLEVVELTSPNGRG